MLAKSLEKMGVSYCLCLWASVILYLFSSMMAIVCCCFTSGCLNAIANYLIAFI